jgi:hypothetical protein
MREERGGGSPSTKELWALSFERYERGEKGDGLPLLTTRKLKALRKMREEKRVCHCQQQESFKL